MCAPILQPPCAIAKHWRFEIHWRHSFYIYSGCKLSPAQPHTLISTRICATINGSDHDWLGMMHICGVGGGGGCGCTPCMHVLGESNDGVFVIVARTTSSTPRIHHRMYPQNSTTLFTPRMQPHFLPPRMQPYFLPPESIIDCTLECNRTFYP